MSRTTSGSHARERVVLLVDDDDNCRAVLAFVLEAAGYATVAADGGSEALTMLREGLRPFAIALDLMMPVVDGYAVLAELGSSTELASIPVVVVSASLIAARPTPGAVAALKKPVDVDALLQVLEDIELPPAQTA